jgi:DNA-binding MarR family transcriptional regulator/catechol 2,3-dioxygenase-like lactoylglutathione lyase family enzyme
VASDPDGAGAGEADDQHHVMRLLVLEAIDAAAGRGPVSVIDVANELGIDRSGASRMVTDAVESGHVRKATSPADARRAALTVTDRGADLLAAARAWQEQVFEDLVADWGRGDAARLASYLRRLAHETHPHPTGGTPTMTIVLNHTIIPATDKEASARFFADLLGLQVGEPAGPFTPVQVNDDLTFDFDDRHPPTPGHYAFLVDDPTFDRVLEQLTASDTAIDFGAGPGEGWNRRINRLNGGRGVYVRDPDGHSYELFTAVP